MGTNANLNLLKQGNRNRYNSIETDVDFFEEDKAIAEFGWMPDAKMKPSFRIMWDIILIGYTLVGGVY